MRSTCTCDSCCGCSTAAPSAFSNMLWINGHIFTLFFSHAYVTTGSILEARAYTWWVWDSQEYLPQFCIPPQKRKGLHCASFPKGLKRLIMPVGWMLLAKDQETTCKKARCAKADFPSQAVADWRWTAQHSTRGFTKIRGNIGEHAADYGETGRATAGEPFARGNMIPCLLRPQFLFINLVKPKFFNMKKLTSFSHILVLGVFMISTSMKTSWSRIPLK